MLMLGFSGLISGGHPFLSPNGLLLLLHVYVEIHVDSVFLFCRFFFSHRVSILILKGRRKP